MKSWPVSSSRPPPGSSSRSPPGSSGWTGIETIAVTRMAMLGINQYVLKNISVHVIMLHQQTILVCQYLVRKKKVFTDI